MHQLPVSVAPLSAAVEDRAAVGRSVHDHGDPDRRWTPFRIEIPTTAPQAVEGRAIAWRYTVEAASVMHRAFADWAVVTPLRFEV